MIQGKKPNCFKKETPKPKPVAEVKKPEPKPEETTVTILFTEQKNTYSALFCSPNLIFLKFWKAVAKL